MNKETLLKEIKTLLSTNDKPLKFNKQYLEYFELDELVEIKELLTSKQKENNTPSKDYLDDIFNRCS